MPANIANFAGQDAVFTSREPAWHGLGITVPDDVSAAEALVLSHTDYEVTKVPAFAFDGQRSVRIPDTCATVRYEDGRPVALGTVSERYHVIQNAEAFAFAEAIIDTGEACVTSAGALGRGERAFLAMRLPVEITVGGVDAHGLFLGIVNGHDGHTALTAVATPVRFVCSNTVTLGLSAARQRWSVRHTSGVDGRVAVARDALKLSYRYAETFETEAERLLATPMSEADWSRFVTELVPEAKDGKAATLAANQRQTLAELYFDAPTQANIRGTRWAAFQAVTEFAEFYRPVRNGTDRRLGLVLGTGTGAALVRKAQVLLSV
ncbi:MAG: DUF932 domain-containing protein [Acidimicrobiales bacterium]